MIAPVLGRNPGGGPPDDGIIRPDPAGIQSRLQTVPVSPASSRAGLGGEDSEHDVEGRYQEWVLPVEVLEDLWAAAQGEE